MSEPDPTVRRTGLMFFPNIALKLRELFAAAGLAEAEWPDVCADCVSANCTICDERLAGREFADWLLTLGAGSPAGKRAMRFIRIERGCCCNPNCNATFYELKLAPHPALVWEQFTIGALEEREEVPLKKPSVVAEAGLELAQKQLTGRSVGALAALLILWFLYQWYNGGSIPLIRSEKTYSSEALPEADSAEGN